jgi:exosortase
MLTSASTSEAPPPELGAGGVDPDVANSLEPSTADVPNADPAKPTSNWANWSVSRGQMALFAAMAAVTLWTYWSTLVRLEARWSAESEHSHGYIVPVISAFLLWLRGEQCDPRKWKGSSWGLVLIGVAVAMRLAAERYLILGLHPLSLLPCLAGIFLTAGGWGALQWAGPSIIFLIFMIPLPNSVEQLLSVPLKGFSAEIASWILQILGEPAVTAGNTLKIGDVRLEIVDACSGMNLLMTMSATVVAYTLIVPRPWLHKVFLLASVIPIAVLSNAFRIAATGILMRLTTSEEAHKLAHDWAGYVIQMPLALVMIALFSAYLGRLLGPATTSSPDPVEK